MDSAPTLLAVSLLLLSPLAARADEPQAPRVGRTLTSWSLQDYRGKTYTLDDFRGHKLLVVAFLGTECPLAKLYVPRLVALAESSGPKGVGFVALNANIQDSITEIAAQARNNNVPFPMLKDVGNRVADELGAERTPEVFLLDEHRTVRYWGRIDDQYGIGYARETPTRNDLEIAMAELLDGKPVSQPVTTAPGCFIGRQVEPQVGSPVTYSNQIARILQQRCVECHRAGEIAPFALTEYGEAAGWAETIGEVVREERMPPWHANPAHGQFLNDRRLTDDEKRLLQQWIEAGAPEGDPAQLPPTPEFVTGWQLAQKPDLVVAMRDRPYAVPAEGTVRYQYFRVDPGFPEDKWIKAVEVLPGNRAVVHHILVFARRRGSAEGEFEGGVRGFLAGYVPGLRAIPFPDGMAKRIPAGAELIFQVHYTPIGTPQEDLSQVGFVFADPREIQYEVKTTSAFQRFLEIPPQDGDYAARARTTLDEPARLLGMMPHMHLRGKAFRYSAQFPGQVEPVVLLDVPHYDFNWQTSYRLATPLELPAGTQMICEARFDNSTANLNNPDPTAKVGWGDQTWDEMMIGYFDIAVPYDPQAQPEAGTEREQRRQRVERFLEALDRNGDGKLSRDEVPPRLKPIFERLDRDQNGELTRAEAETGGARPGIR